MGRNRGESEIGRSRFLSFSNDFLYRHHIELSIKDILVEGHFLEPSCPSFPQHHRLKQLWELARKTIEKVSPDAPKDDLDAMANLINELEGMDRESFAFRYPTTKGGAPSLPSVSDINLATFKDGIEKMASFLEGCREQFATYKDGLTSSWEIDGF
jgi:hypothetical protein